MTSIPENCLIRQLMRYNTGLMEIIYETNPNSGNI
jgi:hypothetical protein